MNQHLDLAWLYEAYRRTRKDGAVGVDGQTAADYEKDLEGNRRSLLERPSPARTAHRPCDERTSRRARVATPAPSEFRRWRTRYSSERSLCCLSRSTSRTFMPVPTGFGPADRRTRRYRASGGRRCRAAVVGSWRWISAKFFDTLDHGHLRALLQQRVRDGVVLRLIGKWLNAGVMEDGAISYPDAGSPQGGVISPMLANVYLHYVLDEWIARDVLPRLKGRAFVVRYADDFVIGFTREDDARRMWDVLPKRFDKYGLTVHPEKTRLVPFRRPPPRPAREGQPPAEPPGTFDLLGFAHYWARSRKGNWVVKRKTAPSRFTRAVTKIAQWCRIHRHRPIAEQHQTLSQKLRGHFAYYGITGNSIGLARFREVVLRVWWEWLGRRRGGNRPTWAKFLQFERRWPLPPPITVHSVCRQRSEGVT